MEEKVKNKGILQDFSLLHALGFAPKANKFLMIYIKYTK